jgi:predicted RNA-binding protein YlxR (DUF448 family)
MKVKKTPMRRCVGCMESKPKRELIRIAGYEGQVSIDLTGKAKGRGVYLCPDKECFAKAAKKKAISRNIEIEITKEQMDKFAQEFEEYAGKNP